MSAISMSGYLSISPCETTTGCPSEIFRAGSRFLWEIDIEAEKSI